MEKIYIKSKQPGIMVKHSGVPRFEFEFKTTEPVLVDSKIAKFLTKNPNFEIIETSQKQKKQIKKRGE